jgi:hypothetical protein
MHGDPMRDTRSSICINPYECNLPDMWQGIGPVEFSPATAMPHKTPSIGQRTAQTALCNEHSRQIRLASP